MMGSVLDAYETIAVFIEKEDQKTDKKANQSTRLTQRVMKSEQIVAFSCIDEP